MTEDEKEAHYSAMRKTAMVEVMVDIGTAMCGERATDLFDLTIASPGIVISLYIAALDTIKEAGCDEVMKAKTRRLIQIQVGRLLDMVMAAVKSTDPRKVLEEQRVILEQSIAMGCESNEIH